MKLPGAKWRSASRGVVVPTTAFEEIEDFAEMLSFSISEEAAEVIKNAYEAKEFVQPCDHESAEIEDKLSTQLDAPLDIPEDLKDK